MLISELALDYAQLGLLLGIYMLPGVVISIPGGMLGSRFGDKTVVICGLLLMLAGGIVTAMTDHYGVALSGRLVSGIGAVLLNVLLSKMTSDWFAGREIVGAMAILVTSWPVGIGAALVIEPWLAAGQGWRWAVHATAIAAGVALVLVASIYRARSPAPSSAPASRWYGLSRHEFVPVSLAGLVWALYNVSYILLVTFAPPLLIERGLSAIDAGVAASLATWTLIVSVPLGGMLIEKTGRPMVLMVGGLTFMAIAIVAVAAAGEARWVIALTGFIAGLPAGAIMAMPTRVLQPQNRAVGMGLFFTWYYLAMALMPSLAGMLRDLSGDPRMPLFFAAALGVATLGILWLFAAATPASASPAVAR
jgi:MFS family permease